MDRAKKSWGFFKYAREMFNIALTSMQSTQYEQSLEKRQRISDTASTEDTISFSFGCIITIRDASLRGGWYDQLDRG
jgi:hypothetical protein